MAIKRNLLWLRVPVPPGALLLLLSLSEPCSSTHLGWVVKHPLLPWLVLVGAQGLGHEVSQR